MPNKPQPTTASHKPTSPNPSTSANTPSASTNSAAAQNSNNPGGLNIGPGNPLYTSLAGIIGTIPAAGGGVITLFDTLQNGINAEIAVIQGYVNRYPNLSILQAVSRYITGNAGSGDESDYSSGIVARAQAIANQLGASITDAIGSFGG